MVNYKAIGKRIRTLRKEKGMTQDDLRYAVNISKTHMSHIETGTTKLSLPTLIDIANVLHTSVDCLLSDSVIESAPIFNNEIKELVSDCTPYEYKTMIDAMRFVKKIIKERNNGGEQKC